MKTIVTARGSGSASYSTFGYASALTAALLAGSFTNTHAPASSQRAEQRPRFEAFTAGTSFQSTTFEQSSGAAGNGAAAIDEQPKYTYTRATQYAMKMGLPTPVPTVAPPFAVQRYDSQVRGPLDQGDLLRPCLVNRLVPWWPDDNELPLVIMTPTCDIAQDKAEHHRYCILQPFCLLLYELGEQYGLEKEHWDGTKTVSVSKSNSIRNKLITAMRNAWPRYHFLPSAHGTFETDYLIDFELVVTTPLDYFGEHDRLARINAPFQQELAQRYAAHVMRIGTPDLAQVSIDATIAACVGATRLRLAA